MDVNVEQRGRLTIVLIIGSLDALNSQSLTAKFNEQIAGGGVNLVVDLSKLDYTSSAGLRALLGALKASRSKGGDLRLAAVQDGVHKVMELSGFTSILKFFPTVDEALKSFGPNQ